MCKPHIFLGDWWETPVSRLNKTSLKKVREKPKLLAPLIHLSWKICQCLSPVLVEQIAGYGARQIRISSRFLRLMTKIMPDKLLACRKAFVL